MKNYFKPTLFAIGAAMICGATSCSNEEDPSNKYYSVDNFYRGECTLIALGDTVSYANAIRVSGQGSAITIDSVAYGRFSVKDFQIRDLECQTKNHDSKITLRKTDEVVEAGGMKFEIKSVDAAIKELHGDFNLVIHPVGMPGDGFKLNFKGDGEGWK